MPGKHALSFPRVAVFSEGATLPPISANILVAVEFWLHTSGEEVERQVARNGCYRSSRFGTLKSDEGKRRGAASMTKAPGRKENEWTRVQSNGAGGVGATDAVGPFSCSRPSKTSMYVDQIYVDRPRRFHWEVAYANS